MSTATNATAAIWTNPRLAPRTGNEPGVRMLAGRPYIFDGGLLGEHYAAIAIETAPADLTALSDRDLKDLETFACSGRASDLHARIWAELSARGFATDGTRTAQVAALAEAA